MEGTIAMNVEIRALTPALADDYMDYFKNTAFADHKDWAGCCCLHFHLDDALNTAYKEFVKTAEKNDFSFSWHYAEKYVRDGVIQGYLAYDKNRVVGWCNVNDKYKYAALRDNVMPEIWSDDDGKKVKSVVCFSIAPDVRRRGIATQLLSKACEDAENQEYDYMEAYPRVGNQGTYVNYPGPDGLYLNYGFVLQTKFEGQAVFRKYFGS